jgi:hypothetical protein
MIVTPSKDRQSLVKLKGSGLLGATSTDWLVSVSCHVTIKAHTCHGKPTFSWSYTRS